MARKRKEPAAKKPPKAAKIAIADFAKDFLADLPAGTESGEYRPTVNDRWAGRFFQLADGDHQARGWTFVFANGALIYARLTPAKAA